jgi:uncharacterized membrane protein YdjX (TVP38/TMEM64 family)
MRRTFQITFVLISALSFCLFFYFNLDDYFSGKNINLLKEYFLNKGNWAFLYIVIIHIVLNLTAIPRVFFTIFAGYVFGVVIGFIYSWIATMVGLVVTFIMVRYLFRGSFEKRFGSKKIVEKINHNLDKHGIWTVVFLRAIYVVPSSVLNYSFGFTKIKTSSYLLGSAVGFIPVVLFNVWAGNTMANHLKASNHFDYAIIIWGILLLVLVYGLKKLSKRFI